MRHHRQNRSANTSNTSAAARESIQSHITRMRGRVYMAVLKAGVRGLTREEIERRAKMKGNSVRPRVCELIDAKLLVPSGEERCTESGRKAVVLIARNAK